MAETVLSGRYRLTERLGAGGMGVVWRAEDLVLHREVAVKTVAGPGVTEEAAARLEREARAAAGLSDNQHVVTVHDFGRDGDTLYIVMALAPGRALDRVLTAEGPPAPAQAVDWARQICVALEAAHDAGIVHRDIKPANAVLGPDGTVRVLDFGIAWFHRDLGLDRLSQAGGVLGSAPWMSPEQARGEEVGAASDLYSLGCLLHQLLTGQPPFGDRDALAQIVAHASEVPDPPSTRRPGLPAELDLLVAELLAKSPENRPPSAAETAARLGAIAREMGAGETTGRPAAPPMHPALPDAAPAPVSGRPVSRRTVLFGVIGLAAVSTTVVVVPKVLEDDGGDKGGGGEGEGDKGGAGQVGQNGELAPRWKRAARDSPVEALGSLVLTHETDGDNRWLTRELASGEERWRAHDQVDAPVTGPDGSLYFAVDSSELHAIDPDDRSVVWKFAPLGDDDVTSGIDAVVSESGFYVAVAQYVCALDAKSGNELWRHTSEDDTGAYTTVVDAGSLVLARLDSRSWDALHKGGALLWSWTFADHSEFVTSVFKGAVDDRLFFANDGDVVVVDATTGDVLATYKDREEPEVLPEGKLLVGTGEAWSATDGKKLWSVRDSLYSYLAGDVLVVQQEVPDEKRMRTLGVDPRTGAELWSHDDLVHYSLAGNNGSGPDTPLIFGVAGKPNHLSRFDPATGDRGPVRTLPEKFILWAACMGDDVFAVCADRAWGIKRGEWPKDRRLYAIPLAQFDN